MVLGPRAGDEWIVLAGLEEGERVVTHAAFQIDSALQLRAKPSMMSEPASTLSGGGPGLPVFRRSLEPVYDAYFAAATALAGDDLAAAHAAAAAVPAALDGARAEGLPPDYVADWSSLSKRIADAAGRAAGAGDLDTARTAFRDWARAILALEQRFAHVGEVVRYQIFCPMAFHNAGASWLQRDDVVLNPYFGASMLRCGAVEQLFPGAGQGESPERPAESTAPVPAEHVAPVFSAYLDAWRALADDDLAASKRAFERLADAVGAVVTASNGDLEGLLRGLAESARDSAAADDIAVARVGFERLSRETVELATRFGHPADLDLREVFCPMAFGKGAHWVQVGEQILNPYFGSEMLHCGTIERALPAEGVR